MRSTLTALTLLLLPSSCASLAKRGALALQDNASFPIALQDLERGLESVLSWPHSSALVESAAEESDRAKRVLVVCLQSSGCSLFAKLLGQDEHTASFVDVWVFTPPAKFPTPESLEPKGARTFVLKTTIQGDEIVNPVERVASLRAKFQPDRVLLFVRHPADNFEHLLHHGPQTSQPILEQEAFDSACLPQVEKTYGYGNRCGSPAGKLRALEQLWSHKHELFDAVVTYEDLLRLDRRDGVVSILHSLGIPLLNEHFLMKRSTAEVEHYARIRMGSSKFPWSNGDENDGPVAITTSPFRSDSGSVELLCPTLLEAYASNFASVCLVENCHFDDDKAPGREVLERSAESSSFDELSVHTRADSIDQVATPNDLNNDGTAGEELRWFRGHTDENNTVVLIFASIGYAETLMNFLAMGRASGALRRNYALVCLDQKVDTLLKSHGGDCWAASPNYGSSRPDGTLEALAPLWVLRTRMLSMLLDDGINVLMTDTDALWLQDPQPLLAKAKSNGADVAASRGREPWVQSKKWGATACMGFVLFQATDGGRALGRALLAQVSRQGEASFDDQATLNSVLDNADLQFDRETHYLEDTFSMGRTKPGTLPGFEGSLSVALLPHGRFVRFCDKHQDLTKAVVAHCQVQHAVGIAGDTSKLEELRKKGLWALRDDWKQGSPDHGTVLIADHLARSSDCSAQCGGGGFCGWCGTHAACCRRDSADDPDECRMVSEFVTDHHECVKPDESIWNHGSEAISTIRKNEGRFDDWIRWLTTHQGYEDTDYDVAA